MTPAKKGTRMPAHHKRRIAMLTSGGDAPGLNAVIRAAVKMGETLGYEMLGVEDGFEGLLGTPRLRVLTDEDVSGLLSLGGTILRTTNRGHFNGPRVADAIDDPYLEAYNNIMKHGLAGLITIGGEGTHAIALELSKMGAPVIGVPKTIDNDLAGTDRTFGFDTALQVASEALDRLHTTAASHNRVMILEVMGRHAGWIALHCGISGGADAILIPEIPFDINKIAEHVSKREEAGHTSYIIVAAEGAFPKGSKPIYSGNRLGGVGQTVAEQLQALTGKEARCVVLGHLQRGGTPTPYDRILSTRFGAAAVRALHEGITGEMVSLNAQDITTVPMAEAVSHLKTIRPHSDLVRTSKGIGIIFGD